MRNIIGIWKNKELRSNQVLVTKNMHSVASLKIHEKLIDMCFLCLLRMSYGSL